ncbi:MAG: methionyl-tRNA formyltransferase [Patescibacteria group bacterium]|jgi:methionyl-tRNA formyltransferase
MPLKIVFLGTPDLSVPFLEALTNEPDFEVTAVLTQPDRPVGRKHELTASPVKQLALTKSIPVFQPEKLKDLSPSVFQSLSPADIFVVVAYGLMIPQKVLDTPRLGCINVHPSLLPKYRGPSPIQSAIANGDAETGISIMLLNKGMDTGPVLAQEKLLLDADETQVTLTEKIKTAGPKLLVDTLKKYSAGEIKPVAQDDSLATVTKLLTREDGKIDWSEPAEKIHQKIRAYFPWPGSWTEIEHNGETLRVKILKTALKDGHLEILEVQPEGSSAMNYDSFVRGYKKII